MIQRGFPTFFSALGLSVLDSARQSFVLLKTLVVIFLYVVRDTLIPTALLLYFALNPKTIPGNIAVVIETLILLWYIVVLIRIDGALGFALMHIATGEKTALRVGIYAYKNGFSFFINSLKTGVLLFFGQMLLVCPCFLLLTNFILSPYLYVLENKRGKAARERSRELAAADPWIVFAQTTYMIIVGYILLIFAAFALLIHAGPLSILIFVLLALFLGLIQSNFIFRLYNNLLHKSSLINRNEDTQIKFKVFTVVSIAIVIVIYLGFKFLPLLIQKY